MNQNFRDAALYADINTLKEFILQESAIVNERAKYGFIGMPIIHGGQIRRLAPTG